MSQQQDPSQQDVSIKTKILLAAKKLFSQQGYDGTSVRQICEEAGGNVALVSYHFGGKENVFRAIFEEYFPGKDLGQYEAEFQDPVNGMKVLIRGVLEFFAQDEELSRIIHQELTMQSPRTEIVEGFVMPVWGKMRELLEMGKERGVFHFQSVDIVFFLTIGALTYHHNCRAVQSWMANQETDLNETIEAAMGFILQGLGCQIEK
ncbi:TetR family transcriptional regulator [Ammoniphilus resinae]|uniref:AcrR family transcriptional regulator n=1 Tax=Ammoniphilus resinae TaxID=861532 RepID=A0ABS4GUT6_9BACL|nr:TetR family transcriptional regulator [Ammoniphilus resinae]MBP1934022.1 AcrR family transcriptional regulator [Ammoniphilus resinae]